MFWQARTGNWEENAIWDQSEWGLPVFIKPMLYYLKVQVMEYSDGRKMIFFPLVSLALRTMWQYVTCDNMTIGAYKLLNNQSKKHQISPEVLSFVTVNQNQDFGHNFFLKLWSQQHWKPPQRAQADRRCMVFSSWRCKTRSIDLADS